MHDRWQSNRLPPAARQKLILQRETVPCLRPLYRCISGLVRFSGELPMATSPGMDYPAFLWIDVVGLGNADFESPGIYKSSKGDHRLFVRIRSPIWTVATGPLIAISLRKKDERMSTFCTNCGRELPDHAVFCPSCGTKMEVPCCPACGKEIELDSMFCIHCGQKLVNDQTEEALETAAHSEEPSSPQNMPALKPEDVIGRWKLVTIQNAENPEWKTHDIPLEEMLYLRFSSKTYSALNAAGVVVGSGQWELSGEKVVTDNGIALLLKDGILAMENPEDGCIYRFCPLEDDIPAPDSSRKLAEEQTFSWKCKKAGRGILKTVSTVTVSLSEKMLTVHEWWHSTLSERDAAELTREFPLEKVCQAELKKRRLSPLYLFLLIACTAVIFFIVVEMGGTVLVSAVAAMVFAILEALFYRFDLCHPELQLHLTSGKKVRLPAETVNDLAPVHAEIVKWARLKSGGDASREKPKSRKKRVLIAVGIVAGAAAVLLGVITCFEQFYLLRKLPETVLTSEAAVEQVREQMESDFGLDSLDADIRIEGGRLADTPGFPQKEGELYMFFFIDFIYDVVATNKAGEKISGEIEADVAIVTELFAQEAELISINQLEYSEELRSSLEEEIVEEEIATFSCSDPWFGEGFNIPMEDFLTHEAGITLDSFENDLVEARLGYTLDMTIYLAYTEVYQDSLPNLKTDSVTLELQYTDPPIISFTVSATDLDGVQHNFEVYLNTFMETSGFISCQYQNTMDSRVFKMNDPESEFEVWNSLEELNQGAVYSPIEVYSSDDGGATWSLSENNENSDASAEASYIDTSAWPTNYTSSYNTGNNERMLKKIAEFESMGFTVTEEDGTYYCDTGIGVLTYDYSTEKWIGTLDMVCRNFMSYTQEYIESQAGYVNSQNQYNVEVYCTNLSDAGYFSLVSDIELSTGLIIDEEIHTYGYPGSPFYEENWGSIASEDIEFHFYFV